MASDKSTTAPRSLWDIHLEIDDHAERVREVAKIVMEAAEPLSAAHPHGHIYSRLSFCVGILLEAADRTELLADEVVHGRELGPRSDTATVPVRLA